MTRRHPVDAAILCALVIGHLGIAAVIARTAHAFIVWTHANV